MNKIEQMHLDAIQNSKTESYYPEYQEYFSEETAASKCAEVTEEVAIEFAEWCRKPHPEDPRQGNVVYVPNGNFYWYNHKQYTTKELFQEFLKTRL